MFDQKLKVNFLHRYFCSVYLDTGELTFSIVGTDIIGVRHLNCFVFSVLSSLGAQCLLDHFVFTVYKVDCRFKMSMMSKISE